MEQDDSLDILKDPETVDFEPAKLVEQYRDAVARIESAANESARERWKWAAQRLRKQWAQWQGEDSLHEMAFGEPCE